MEPLKILREKFTEKTKKFMKKDFVFDKAKETN